MKVINYYTILNSKNVVRKYHMEDLGVDGRIISAWV
jgi:hypothetical protein